MRSLLAIITCCLFGVTGVVGRQLPENDTCRVNPNQLPAIRGLQLGMSQDQVLRLFPGSADNPDIKAQHAPEHFDQASLQLVPNYIQFPGVNQLLATFYREKLVSFTLQYSEARDGGVNWRNVDEFIARLSQSLSIPGPQVWTSGKDMYASYRALQCAGFELLAAPNILIVRDPSYIDDVNRRRIAAAEERRRTFRP
jgi:hypothetical protein